MPDNILQFSFDSSFDDTSQRSHILEGYRSRGGQHPETTVLKNIMAYYGVVAPHTLNPLSEALILGISGGLGFGYVLFDFKYHVSPVIALHFKNHWQFPLKTIALFCKRMGIKHGSRETNSKETLIEEIALHLNRGTPVVLQIDPALLSYLRMPVSSGTYTEHIVGCFGIDAPNELLHIDDRALKPFYLPFSAFNPHGSVHAKKLKRLVVLERPGDLSIEQAVYKGLIECSQQLNSKSVHFSLNALKKMADNITGSSKKSWQTHMLGKKGSLNVLRNLYESLIPAGPEGGTLRDIYAQFLEESASILSLPALKTVSEHYRKLSFRWLQLAESALPDDIELFCTLKSYLMQKNNLYYTNGDEGATEINEISDSIFAVHREMTLHPPLGDQAIKKILDNLQAQLYDIHDMEREAAGELMMILDDHIFSF